MSIADNLQRLVIAKTDIANAITEMGGTVNTGDGFEEFPADIATIPTGGDIQVSWTTCYLSGSSSYDSSKVSVYNPYNCSIEEAGSGSESETIPIITTSSNVFICVPISIRLKGNIYRADVSYKIPSNFPSKYGYNASTITLHSITNSATVFGGRYVFYDSRLDFYVDTPNSYSYFGNFTLKFDKT